MGRISMAGVKKAIVTTTPAGFARGGVDGALLRKESAPKVSKNV